MAPVSLPHAPIILGAVGSVQGMEPSAGLGVGLEFQRPLAITVRRVQEDLVALASKNMLEGWVCAGGGGYREGRSSGARQNGILSASASGSPPCTWSNGLLHLPTCPGLQGPGVWGRER